MKRLSLIGLVALALAAGSIGRARAQGGPPGGAPPPATGDLRVLVFVDDQPVAGAMVEVAGVSRPTTADGAVQLTLPEGKQALALSVPRHLLPAAQPGGQPIRIDGGTVEIVAGEEVEAIVTLDLAGGVRSIDVETAAERAEERRRQAELEKRQKALPRGVVRGRVFTREGERPVSGVRIFVRQAPVEAETDDDGAFELTLPEGTYDLVLIHASYITVNLEKVEVDANRPGELRVALEKATPQLDDFVVTAPHIEGGVAALVTERRESTSVDEVIGAEEMSRSGDSDAAGALKRVTGITVVGGQFVYVRGMGERYSATLLNGQAIPSPEPERRVIPLDLFSTDVLESVVIQKTPSPDTPAEFGGGIVQLRTKGFPDHFTLSASASIGLLSTASLQSRPSYRGGATDFLGFDDGSRALPRTIRDNSPLREGNRFEEGFTTEELAEMGRLLPVSYDVTDQTVAPATGLSLSIGDKREIAGLAAGFLLSLSHGIDYDYKEEINRRFIASDTAEGGLELNNDFVVSQLVQAIGSSGIFVTGIEPDDGDIIKSTTLLLRVTDNETAVVTGRSDDLGRDIRRYRLRFVERQLIAEQLAGEHELSAANKAILAWRYAFSRASRSEPDRREYFYADESSDPDNPPDDFQISVRPAGNQRIWSDLTDQIHDLGVDYSQPFEVWSQLEARVKVGGTAVWRNRDFDTLRLTMRAPRMLSDEARRQRAEQIWATDNIDAADGWVLEDTTQPTDAYTAEQQIQAGFAMATVPISKRVELTGGVRVERSRQKVTTFSPFSREANPLISEIDDTDLLPSLQGKLQLTDEILVRGGYGRTVTRPDFRELSESQFRDVVTATRFVGNPELERGTIDNVDLRFEYYFSTDELASLSGFYKSFNSPIEQIDLGGVDRSVSWDNADSARNLGVELELRRRGGFLHDRLADAFAAVNVALISSQVDLGEDAAASTSTERPLQGQSPYVVNLQLGYDDAAGSGITAVLLYNVFGRRIRDVGRLGTPDIWEQPVHQVDLVYSQKLGERWKLKLKGTNLLDQAVEFRQASKVPRRYRNGREFAVSLGWSY